jgi:hypothetical protein
MKNNDRLVRELLRGIGHNDNRYFRPVPASYGYLRPGDIISFQYNLEEAGGDYSTRLCLVVRNDTGSVGYLSLRDNWLLSCFSLNEAPVTLIKYIIERLYKNRNLCSRRNIVKGLTILLGSYRTYMLRRMHENSKFFPDLNKIKSSDLYGFDFDSEDL